MELTNTMRRCLILLDEYGEAVRVWSGSRVNEWSWHINGTPMSYGVDRCIRAGLVKDGGSRNRLILSSLGREVLIHMSRDERLEADAGRVMHARAR